MNHLFKIKKTYLIIQMNSRKTFQNLKTNNIKFQMNVSNFKFKTNNYIKITKNT